MHSLRVTSLTLLGLLAAAGGLCACRSWAGDGRSQVEPAALSVAERITAIERQRLRALVEPNTAVADALHADDFQLINPVGETLTKSQYRDAIASGAIDHIVWEPEEMKARVCGEAAVLRYRSMLEIVADGRRSPPRAHWHANVYEERDGDWQLVWSQATVIR